MKDVMIDFETFGNGKNALVVQVGAVYFDRYTGETGEELKINFDARSVVRSGGEIDADTVYFWLAQSREAIDSFTKGELLDVTQGIAALNDFLKKATWIWSHATFDFVILTETLKRLNIKPNFSYRAARDIRTLVDLAGDNVKKDFTREGVHHDALDDCKFQIKYCVSALRKVQG